LLICATGYLPYAIARWPQHIHARPLASIVVLGVVCTALAFVTFFALIAAIGAPRATVITYVNPAVALTLGVLFLGEDFTFGMGIGFPMILVGSVLAARKSPEPDALAAPEAVVAELSVDAHDAERRVEDGRDDSGLVVEGV